MNTSDNDNQQKREYNLTVGLMLNQQLAALIGDTRLANCGRVTTLCCKTCHAFAICKKYLHIPRQCGRRYCMLCQKLNGKQQSQERTTATIELIKEYETLGQPIIPCVLTLTVIRKPYLPLRGLLLTMSEAWEMLRQGGEKKEWIRNRRLGIEPWWRQYFVGEVFSFEFPWAADDSKGKSSGWHPHLHALCLRYYHRKAPLGTHPWTGAVTDRPGIRNLWHQYLKICWQKQFALGNLPEPFPTHLVEGRHIEQAKTFINEAALHTFEDMQSDGILTAEQQQCLAICQQTTDLSERTRQLGIIKKLEAEKLEKDRHQLLGREIATTVNIKLLYVQLKDASLQERRVPISVYFDQKYRQ
ncbi:MAG: hypothetical protein LiPW30_768 [Parcubacteria group bacterium LiPW_30]|nr:MAG: hypothetical protein LiPW30_768 [Parcubacteria group bacterium LiPW_30]